MFIADAKNVSGHRRYVDGAVTFANCAELIIILGNANHRLVFNVDKHSSSLVVSREDPSGEQ
jgi:sulfate adenylyltransferase subunit 1 (EFTu-like GTPase family)